ncbi:DNA replication factor Cdt1-like [Asterias rubens]|uniref:DNA replication factor Cdt1-like n=1 Tax=Asterias rubens TaxID=7604 RepID=UPI0014552FC0|nr:DNA replication factor Cdt1-like [Asterias rubens]
MLSTPTATAKSKRISRTTSVRPSRKAKGPLDKHVQIVSKSPPAVRLSPPSTPTKRPQRSGDTAPSQKKRCRIGSIDTVAESSDQTITETPSSVSRRRVHAERKGVSAARGRKSVKKSLESSLLECLNTKSPGDQCESQKPSKSTMASNKSTSEFTNVQELSSSTSSSLDSGKLQSFIEKSSQSVSSSTVNGSTSTARVSSRIRGAVKDVLQIPSASAGSSLSNNGGKIQKKLSPAQMREQLSKTCKLSDLQARLSKVKQFVDQSKIQQKATKDSTSLAKSSSKKAKEASSEKMDETFMPAYQKYSSLIKSSPDTLTLPFKYRILEEMFRSMDTVVSMLHNRSETCSFPKLKQAVQEMCRRTFELRNVGQIKTVYPTAYFMKRESKGPKDKTMELIIETNTGSGVQTPAGPDSSEPSAPTKNSSTCKLMSRFTPSMLIARRTIFHNNLLDIVKEHHCEFLSNLDRPLSVPNDKLTRWHPKFPLDQIAEVESADLPQPPAVKTYNTAKDVLDKARVVINPRVAKALEVVAKNSALLKAEKEKPKVEEKSSSKQPVKNETKTSAVSGVNQSLLDRIRAKEAMNLTAMMTRNPADQERISMLERLPELCRILRVYFIAEKKAAIPVESAVLKLTESYQSALSKAQCEKHVSLMVETLPEWVTMVKVRKDQYLKINKTKDMVQVNERLRQLLRESKYDKGQS